MSMAMMMTAPMSGPNEFFFAGIGDAVGGVIGADIVGCCGIVGATGVATGSWIGLVLTVGSI